MFVLWWKCATTFFYKKNGISSLTLVDKNARFFNQPSKFNHYCKDKTRIYEIVNNDAKIRRGTPQFQIFAMPVTHIQKKSTVWWIGTGMRDLVTIAKEAIRRCELAKENNYVRPKTGGTMDCPSLSNLLDPEEIKDRYTPHPEQAVLLPVLGGNNNAMQKLRNWIRIILKTPGHHKGKNANKIYKRQRTRIIENLLSIQNKMPPVVFTYVYIANVSRSKWSKRFVVKLLWTDNISRRFNDTNRNGI